MFEICGTVLAVYLLLMLAFPKVFLPPTKYRTKKVGSNYWGVYDGQPVDLHPHAPTLQTPKPARLRHPVAGSSMYAGGNGMK